jgi:hypothetical protein
LEIAGQVITSVCMRIEDVKTAHIAEAIVDAQKNIARIDSRIEKQLNSESSSLTGNVNECKWAINYHTY